MKVLKIIVVAFVLIVVAFFALGLVFPEVEYGHTIAVNKSIEEAWAVSQDESKFHLWLEGFKSIERIEGEMNEVGSKYRVVVNPGDGQPDFEMIETLVAVNPPNSITMHFDSEMMVFEQTMTFVQEGTQVKISTDSKVIGKSLPTRSMFAIMEVFSSSFTIQEAKNIDALKRVIDEA